MSDDRCFAFVQARMSSTRLPGKMLMNLQGKAIIDHILDAAATAVGQSNTVLLTSADRSDDPLARHAEKKGSVVFRGSLENVFGRFQGCLKQHPCEWFFRICGDSPFLDPTLLDAAWARAKTAPQSDIITNVFPRTFPAGQSVELLNSHTFAGIGPDTLDDEDREHVTRTFYRHPEQYRIEALRAAQSYPQTPGFAVDTPEDLARLERFDGRPKFTVMN